MEEERRREEKVQVELLNHFTLYGVIVDKNNSGIWLKTSEQTSFINYDGIYQIKRLF